MSPKLSQSLKQTQGLVITPQLQQAIKMLTLTHLEMTNVISEEMVENPMLEELGSDTSEKTETLEAKIKKLKLKSLAKSQYLIKTILIGTLMSSTLTPTVVVRHQWYHAIQMKTLIMKI